MTRLERTKVAIFTVLTWPALVLAQTNPAPTTAPNGTGTTGTAGQAAQGSSGAGWWWIIIVAAVIIALIWWAGSQRRRPTAPRAP